MDGLPIDTLLNLVDGLPIDTPLNLVDGLPIDTPLNLVVGLPRRGEGVIAAKGGANSILNPPD